MTHSKNLIIKVCGMREADNIRAVDELASVDWMGFIFYPRSSRHVSQVPAFMPEHTKRVGVFVNATANEILEHLSLFSLDLIQLHGHESADFCRELRALLPEGTGIIKMVQVGSIDDLQRATEYEGTVDYLLFETRCEGYGGSGQQFDWRILDDYHGRTPFLLTGGIGPCDADKMLSFSHPMMAGIDLNSKFESAPAMKDVKMLKDFTERLRQG